MSKNKFVGHAPRPTKAELHKAAQEQHKANEAKAAEEAATAPTEATGAAETPLVSPATETNAPVAEEPAAPAAPVAEAPAPKKTEAVTYALGKKYVPKTDRNSETWAKLTAALKEGPKTMKQLAEVAENHKDFIGYMTRGGHIIPHVAAEVAAQAAAN